MPATRCWVEEVAGLADVREIKELLRGFFGRRAVRVVGSVALLVVVVVLFFLILNWYIAPTKPSQRKELVLAVAQILGGTALLSGLYFTWRTLQVNREGQITERFTRAIDQLGKVDENNNKLLEIRIGGIYALERIARASAKDYWPIMVVLTAYVRQHAPWLSEESQESPEDASMGQPETTTDSSPTPDIQAIITVLRRTHSYRQGKRESHGVPDPLDLRETNLRRANLERAYLTGADLREAFFPGAILRGAHLWAAHLWAADLWAADLWRADLSGAELSIANLSGADLSETDLSGTYLSGANLSGAVFSGAQHLTQEQLEQTVGDEDTQLPPNLETPAHWDVKTDEQAEGS